MKRKTNKPNFDRLEARLAALVPMPDDELAAKILLAAEDKTLPSPVPAQVFTQMSQPAQHASCFASTLPLLTGLAGGLIGAAVMFFAVTLFLPPKVEIREVVRYVPVESPPEPETVSKNAETPGPEVVPDKTPREKTPEKPRELPWVLALFYPTRSPQAVAYRGPADLDAMIEQRAQLARQSALAEPRPQLLSLPRTKAAPSEFSPLMYRETIEKWNL